jgi:hypothetical protein
MARTSYIAFLVAGLSALRLASGDEPVSPSPAAPDQIHRAVERAIGYLQKESASWLKTRKCAACHHVALPIWSLIEAEQQGYSIDKAFVAETVEATLGSAQQMIASKLFNDPADPPDTRPIGQGVRTGAAFMAVAAQTLTLFDEGQKQSLNFIADQIVSKQRDNGSWEFFLSRPPINENETTDAAWLMMALQREARFGPSDSQRSALAKAMVWFEAVTLPDNLQDKVFKLLLATRGGKPRAEMQSTIDELLALQQADGGWRQNADMSSDAYATGQTLYVLALVGETADNPSVKRAMDLLVATQKPDGSRPMTSRSTPDGKPGSSTLLTPIVCAASSWATLGLARLAPEKR